MLTYQQQIDVNLRVKHFVEMANDIFNTDMDIDSIRVRFDKRGTTAGTALYVNQNIMELNFNAGLMTDNWNNFWEDTIPHEVAHLVKNHIYGQDRKGRMHSPHGYYWQDIMRKLGVEPSRCHDMDVSKVAQPKKKFIYVCECCDTEVVLTSVRHNRMVRGTHNYQLHRGAKLVLKKRLGNISTREAIQHKNEGTVPTRKAAQTKKPKAPAGEPKQGTKIARALEVYKAHRGESRQAIIGQIALTLGLTDHQAAGYYQNCKKRIG